MRCDSRKIKIAAVCLCLLFVLTTAIGLLALPVRAFAANDTEKVNTLKFKQVAVGEDFAMALSYDGDVYAWSLLNKGTESSPQNGGNSKGYSTDKTTLGTYYPATPIRIDIDFKGYNATNGVGVDLPSNETDIVVQIAATRHTAAAVTELGYIYVWGKEEQEPAVGGSASENLLLRPASPHASYYNQSTPDAFEPALVDYSTVSALRSLIAENTIQVLEGGAHNYIVYDGTNSYIWGQSVYNLLNHSDPYAFGKSESIIQSFTGRAYVGDGNTFQYDTQEEKLKIRGKNYTVGKNAGVSGSALSGIRNTFVGSGEVGYQGTVHAYGALDPTSSDPTPIKFDRAVFSGDGVLDTTTISVKEYEEADLKQFQFLANDTADAKAQYTPSAISAGAGYAYVLSSSGSIVKVGTGVAELAPGGTFTQVVAGRILTGKPILEGIQNATIKGTASSWSDSAKKAINAKWDTDNTANLASDYTDGTGYISAALNASSEVTVWGNIANSAISKKLDLTSCGIGGTDAKHKVAALFGGYADTLFMLTNLGKIVRVQAKNASEFSVTLYDAFTYVGADNQVKDIQNWDVVANATSATPTVEFNAGVYDTKEDKALASATVDLNSITAVGMSNTDEQKLQLARSYVKINGNSLTSVTNAANLRIANEIVRLNNSGDAYRMILPTNDTTDASNKNAYGDNENFEVDPSVAAEGDLTNNIIIGTAPANVGKLSFYWNSSGTNGSPTTEMPADVAFRYFKIKYNYNETDKNVSFTVTPKRSTQGRAIVMRFWVGRYDYTEKFGVDGAKFYDFKPVEISIKIGNTPIEPIFTTATGEEGSQKSALPLLDANNPYNKYYSIAVMDVSSGLDEIRKILNENNASRFENSDGSTATETNFDALDAITNLITDTVDRGFPAKSKIVNGDLVYYGLATDDNTSDYYNNKYPYLAKDRDGDVLRFIDINGVGALQGSNTYFDYNVATVQFAIPFVMPTDAGADKIRNTFSATTANSNVPWFDNQYGLTIVLTEDTSATTNNATLTVSYQVLRITAKASMGNGWVGYTKGDISDPELRLLDTNVNDRNNMSGTVLRPEIGSNENKSEVLNNTDNDEAGVMAGTNVHRALEVFTQSSLRLSGSKLGGNAGSVYGKVKNSGTVQEYTYQSISFSMRDATHDIDFADFFDNIDNITVAYSNNSDSKPIVGEDAWDGFVNSFGGAVAPFSVAVLHPSSSVRATSLRLTAHRAVQNYKMTVELRRLLPDVDSVTDGTTYLFSAGENNAEVIRIHFEITVTFNQAGLFSPSEGANHPPYENPVSVLIDSRMTTDPVFLRDYCTVEVSSSRPTVATATIASDNNTILFDLLSSGTTYIEYTVTVNASNGAYVYKDSFQVNVITLVSLAKTVNVSSREEVALDDLKNEIARVMSGMQDADASNDSFYESLSLDKSDPAYPNGYYFESTSGTSSVDSENVWEKIESIPFLDVSLGDDDKYIGMRIKQFNSAQTQAITRIVMLFTDGTRTYRASFRVAPAVKVMKDTVDQMENGDLILEINKGDGTISIANRGENGIQAAKDNKFALDGGMFTLPWEFFASAIDSNIVNKTYEILVVRAQSFDGTVNYSKYVRAMPDGLGTAVCLTPLYPTDGCNVQVSLREKGVADATVTTLNFTVRVTGIKTVLSASEYRTVLLAVFFSVLALLIIIFFIRMGIYWRKKAEQRRIIKKNQTLIKMREKMHNKTEAVSKEKLVHTKLKMEDPKYAKMFSEMRKEKEAQTGISLENSVIAGKAERKAKAAKASKKKGGKKSIEELQAELAAKREAVARMQMGDFSAVPDMTAASDIPVEGAVTMPVDDISVDGVPLDEQVPVFDAEAGFDGMSAEELDAQFKAAMGDMPFDTDNNNDNGNQG